uniref:hypothetical protein n=1 Tax=Roseivirga sp. TaxID=1964215 RepID=UPI004048916E
MENDIIKFLLGEDSFDGVWFGENHPTEQGAFWWRKHLRQFINDNQALRIHDVVERSEQLACVHPYDEVYQSETECYCEKCGKDLTKAS